MSSLISDLTDAIGLTDHAGQEELAKEAAAEQEKANDLARAEAELANSKSRRQAVAERRVRQADIVASADASGVGQSSSALTSAGAIGSDTAGNIGAANNQLASAYGQQIAAQNITDLNNQLVAQQQKDAMAMQLAMTAATMGFA